MRANDLVWKDLGLEERVGAKAEADRAVAVPGFLLLRAFLAQFWLLQFYGKVHDAKSGTVSLANLEHWSRGLTDQFMSTTPLPVWMLRPYTMGAPLVELLVGLLILVGLQTRRALILAAALLVSLDVGLMLQAEYEMVKWNTIILMALLWAMRWEPWNAFSADSWLAKTHHR